MHDAVFVKVDQSVQDRLADRRYLGLRQSVVVVVAARLWGLFVVEGVGCVVMGFEGLGCGGFEFGGKREGGDGWVVVDFQGFVLIGGFWVVCGFG